MTIDLDRTITEMRSWINDNQVNYDEAKTKMADPEFVKGTFLSVRSFLSDLMSYNPITSGDQTASFIIGRTQVRFARLLEDIEFIGQFEEEVARFEEAAGRLENAAEE